ncbi:MAG: hypothetical protein JWR80_10005 [Bradyrhizobium sp.]|nr:hypothetical protein [Bradyrhizobium sp.]
MTKTLKEREIDRDRRNLNPTAEAYIAMNLWGHEYAHEQRGGSMDFWDSLDEHRKQRCTELARLVRKADRAHGVVLPNGD